MTTHPGSEKRHRRDAGWRRNLAATAGALRDGRLRRYLGDRYVLRFKIRPVKHLEGWLTPAEAATLYRLARGLPPGGTAVEIGSWKGKSTYCIARGLPPGATVAAVDPFDAAGEEGSADTYRQRQGDRPLLDHFRDRMLELGVADRVTICPGYSRQFAGHFPAIHLLFIDGDHSREGCAFDYDQFAPAVVPGGIVAFHDVRPERGPDFGPNWVVANRVEPSGDFDFVDHVDSLWIARRT